MLWCPILIPQISKTVSATRGAGSSPPAYKGYQLAHPMVRDIFFGIVYFRNLTLASSSSSPMVLCLRCYYGRLRYPAPRIMDSDSIARYSGCNMEAWEKDYILGIRRAALKSPTSSSTFGFSIPKTWFYCIFVQCRLQTFKKHPRPEISCRYRRLYRPS